MSDDEGKGGSRPPPRNKMPLSQTFQRCIHGSVSPILSLSTNNVSSLLPTTSSCHDASYKEKLLSPFGNSSGSTQSATRLDSYHSDGLNLSISLTQQTKETTNCQTLCDPGHLKPAASCFYKPKSFTNTRSTPAEILEDGDDSLVPTLSLGKSQHNTNRGNLNFSSTKSSMKLTIGGKDATQANGLNSTSKDSTAPSFPDIPWMLEPLNGKFAPSNPKKRSTLIDEANMLRDPYVRLQLKRTAYRDGVFADQENAKINRTSTGPSYQEYHESDGSGYGIVKILRKNEDEHALRLGDMGRTGDISEMKSRSGLSISPEEVTQIIGQERYSIARRTIVEQQRAFAFQIFELHRLIKVQKSLAASPDLLVKDGFYRFKNTPPEDILHTAYSTKENRYTHRSNCNTIPVNTPPPSIAKQPPWCFLPPPPSTNIQPPHNFLPPSGNQWLVPVRSPSEGLIYKPYTGLCPPPAAGAYSFPASYEQGIGMLPNFTSYGLPIMNPYCSPQSEENVNFTRTIKNSCNVLSLEKWEITASREGESNSSDRDKVGDELPLFPTAPESDELPSDQKIKVIKVVPHNPKLASESAARIFQSIQDGRKQYE